MKAVVAEEDMKHFGGIAVVTAVMVLVVAGSESIVVQVGPNSL
jgi:hypothetical protein